LLHDYVLNISNSKCALRSPIEKKICVNIEASLWRSISQHNRTSNIENVNQKWLSSLDVHPAQQNQPILVQTRAHQNNFQFTTPTQFSRVQVQASKAFFLRPPPSPPAPHRWPPCGALSGPLLSRKPPAFSSSPLVVSGFGHILGFVMSGCWV
jgi:hypothetical protein